MARSTKVHHNGMTFDSKVEFERYLQLLSMQQAGEISNLECHPKFELAPKFKHDGKTIRAITYTADFQYIDHDSALWIVEDVKGAKWNKKRGCYEPYITPASQLRMKWFKYKYGSQYTLRIVAM